MFQYVAEQHGVGLACQVGGQVVQRPQPRIEAAGLQGRNAARIGVECHSAHIGAQPAQDL